MPDEDDELGAGLIDEPETEAADATAEGQAAQDTAIGEEVVTSEGNDDLEEGVIAAPKRGRRTKTVISESEPEPAPEIPMNLSPQTLAEMQAGAEAVARAREYSAKAIADSR